MFLIVNHIYKIGSNVEKFKLKELSSTEMLPIVTNFAETN